nr:XRE family transcriptional regulator [Ancylobacter tetraedralis]
MLVSNLGALIRRERQKRDMTMVELCQVAAISPAFLSLVERGKSTPSLGTLGGIAKALGLSTSSFLQIGLPPDSVTREGSRPEFAIHDSPVRYERMSTVFSGQMLNAVIMHIPAGYRSKTITNIGEEWIYILKGELLQVVDDTSVLLRPGDTCHFRGDSPHSYMNKGRVPARIIWVGTVSLFGDLPASAAAAD